MSDLIDIKRSQATIAWLSHKYLRRVHAQGGKSHILDDVRQEMWIAFCKARDTFDPNGGASFNTYLVNGIKLHMGRHIEKHFQRFHGQTVAMSFDAPAGDEGMNGSFGDTIADDNATDAENEAISKSVYADFVRKLSPKAGEFVRLLSTANETLSEEFVLFRDKARHAETMGLTFNRPGHVSSSMIFDLMGVSRTERTHILNEIKHHVERV